MSSSATKINPPAVLLFGPTAVGKTALLRNLFAGTGEIISTDSQQIYKGLNIGTAKPTPGECRDLPHHLIDIIPPTESFSAGDFVRLADNAAEDIISRGKLPVLSGGTGFYFRNWLMGLPPIPPVPGDIRSRLNSRLTDNGLASLVEELKKNDPLTAARIDLANPVRVVRALEVLLGTGQSLSSYEQPSVPRNDYRTLIIGLRRERQELYRRINDRVLEMFKKGLLNEIEGLVKDGLTAEDPGMKAIGYKEYFSWRSETNRSKEELMETIQRNTRRYAKRQITFFKSLPDVHWFHPDETAEIKKIIAGFISA